MNRPYFPSSVSFCLLLLTLCTFSSLVQAVEEQVRVSNNNDDAEERISDGDMYRDSSDLELGYDGYRGGLQLVGMRFRSVDVPQGANISSAYIEFEVDETDSGTTNLVIYGHDTDDASGIGNNDNNLSNRISTSATVDWSPPAWNSVSSKQQTPNIESIIQEIVDRPGWSANNDMVLLIEPGSGCSSSSCQRTAESRNGERANAPLLVINYDVGPDYSVSSVHGACGVDNLLIVEYDDTIDSDALDTSYYTLSAGTVSSVTQQDDTTVVLQVVGIEAGQAYTLTVEGTDHSVDFSGLTGHYFDQRSGLGVKVSQPLGLFTGNEYLRKDLQLDFDWQTNTPSIFPNVSGNDERFSIRWNGYIVPADSGDYEFRFRSDDGMRLDLDGVEIITDWSVHAPRYSSVSVAQTLNAGQGYPIEVEHFEHTGQAVAELEWRRGGGSWEVVPAASLNSCAVTELLPDPIADYRMDEDAWTGASGDVVDSSSNSNSGTSQNGLNTTAAGHLCRAGEFDGIDDYIESSAVGSTLTGTSSMSFWLKTTQVGNDTGWRAPGIAGVEESGGSDDIFWGWIDASGRIGLSVGDDFSSKSTAVINDNVFHHVVLTRDAITGAYKIYIDGVLDKSGTLATGIIGNTFNSIGRIEDTGGSPEYYQGLLDEVKIYDRVLNDTQVGALYTETRSCGPLEPLAHFAFEQGNWSGAGVTIDDYTGNGNAGVSVGNAQGHSDGKVCRGSFIPNNTDRATIDAINSQLDLDTAVGNQGTILLWYRAESNWVGSGDRTIIDATTDVIGNDNDKYFYLAKQNDGRLRFALEDSSDDDFNLYSSVNSIVAGTWVHLGVSWDFSADEIQIYLDGSVIASGSISSNGSIGDVGNIYFGDNSSSYNVSPGSSAYGRLDEIKVYNTVLTDADATEAMGAMHPCIFVPSVDYYEITHDGSGLTCDSESITIKACANSDCSSLSTDSVSLDFQGDGSTISSQTFTGSTTFNFNHTTAEILTLSTANETIAPTNPLECANTSGGASCDIEFTDAGFRFLYGAANSTTIANQIAGNSFADTLKLQAVENVNGVCTGLFNGNVDVELAQQSNTPGNVSSLDFRIGGSAIAKNSSAGVSGYTTQTLNFGADSIATITNPVYEDAGQISLHARYQLGGLDLSGSSNQFWVRPHKLVLSAQTSGGSDIDGATSSSPTSHKAGTPFIFSVTAVNSAGTVTPNYQVGQLQLSLERTGPVAGGVDGSFTYASAGSVSSSLAPGFQNVSLESFVNGISSYSSASYSEVGLLNLDVQDINYGGQGTTFSVPGGGSGLVDDTLDIGRFTPNHFIASVEEDGAFAEACSGSFSYIGQPFTYATVPTVKVSAMNLAGNPTFNYTETGYMKLQTSDFVRSFPGEDDTVLGQDNINELNAEWLADPASQGSLSVPTAGEVLFTFSAGDNYRYIKDANAEVGSFTADLSMDLNSVSDSDGTAATNTPAAFDIAGTDIRYGRWKIENALGPETQVLKLPMSAEYFDGANYVLNTNDSCSTFNASDMQLITSLTTSASGSGTIINGRAALNDQIELSLPGQTGSVDLCLNVAQWLMYDWNGDGLDLAEACDITSVAADCIEQDSGISCDNSTSRASFGQYRGHDRIIYWREVSN